MTLASCLQFAGTVTVLSAGLCFAETTYVNSWSVNGLWTSASGCKSTLAPLLATQRTVCLYMAAFQQNYEEGWALESCWVLLVEKSD